MSNSINFMSKESKSVSPMVEEQICDLPSVSETVCVTVYGGDFAKFSEATLAIPNGTFRIKISSPEKEVSA